MPDRPPEMYQNGRGIEPFDDPGEWFYYRIQPAFIRPDYTLEPLQIKLSVQCPDLSSNRQRFSESWYVLYPRTKYETWAVYKFQQQQLPTTVQSDNPEGGVPTTYTVTTVHDPCHDNYGHCETRFFRGIERVTNGINKNAKNVFRMEFARVAVLERRAGEIYPPH